MSDTKYKLPSLVKKWNPIVSIAELNLSAKQKHIASQLLETKFASNVKVQQLLTETPVWGVQDGMIAPTTGVNVSGDPNDGNVGDGKFLAGTDSIAISMILRAIPSLIAFDMVGVQPIKGPTASIFASSLVDENGNEWLNPANPNQTTTSHKTSDA